MVMHHGTRVPGGVYRVSLALDPVDVDLLDRMAVLQGTNRSAQVRELLAAVRPNLQAGVEAFEKAVATRESLDAAAVQATAEAIGAITPRIERVQRELLGALAHLEGQAAADPRVSNQGGHTPNPSPGDVES